MARRFNIFNVPVSNCAPDLPENQRVQLTSVGQALYQPANQLKLGNTAGCDLFATGYSVCLAFLDFYKANGGTAQFGNPISPFEFHENLIVQYFEKARFEWRADRPEDQRVVLTDLGRLYFDQLGEDPAQLKPVKPLDATINPILSIKLRAFVLKASDPTHWPADRLCDRAKPNPAGGFECHRQSHHHLAGWENRRLFLHHKQFGGWYGHVQFCRSKAGGACAD